LTSVLTSVLTWGAPPWRMWGWVWIERLWHEWFEMMSWRVGRRC